MKSHLLFFLVFFLLLMTLAGCQLPQNPTQNPTMNPTQAMQTVAAIVEQTTNAQSSLQATSTQTIPSPQETKIFNPTLSSPVTLTITPSVVSASESPSTPTAICDQAAAGNPIDVTIPDDTHMQPGQGFTKIWRLINTGACPWTKEYAVRFFYGTQMNAPDIIYLDQIVNPGEALEITIDMTAPLTPGTHQGNWKLRNATGQLFGIGPGGDAPFWVRIVVVIPPTQTAIPTHTPTPSATTTTTPTPTQTYTPTPAISQQGSISLSLTDLLDLDTGIVNPESGADLTFDLNEPNGSFHILQPQDSTAIGIVGNVQPSLNDCLNAAMSSAPITLESLSSGAYLCYRTNLGLPGWLRYVSLDSENGVVNADFNTWALP